MRLAGVVALGAVWCGVAWGAQGLGSLEAAPARRAQYVVYAAEPEVVPAGKRGALELRFQVAEGFHVNSHTPNSELLTATQLELEPGPGVKLAGAMEYSQGMPLHFAFDPAETLDVYTDGFTVKVPVVAAGAGVHALRGVLRYQACNRAACYPVKTLPVEVLFTAR